MTRIYFHANGDANSYALIDQDANKWLMTVLVNGEHTTARQAEILERMAACWNACEGVSTEALQKYHGNGGIEDATDEDQDAVLDELQAQRDELMATIIAAASLAHHGTAAKLLLDEAIAKVS
jgi:hypothetical protein